MTRVDVAFILSTYLVFPFKHQQVSDFAKGNSEGDYLCFGDLSGNLPHVEHTGGATQRPVSFELLAVVAISCRTRMSHRSHYSQENHSVNDQSAACGTNSLSFPPKVSSGFSQTALPATNSGNPSPKAPHFINFYQHFFIHTKV